MSAAIDALVEEARERIAVSRLGRSARRETDADLVVMRKLADALKAEHHRAEELEAAITVITGPPANRIEDAETIESIVGVPRHPVDHMGRAVSAEKRVYILHSERCRARYADLRHCPYSRVLDRGIDETRWAGFEDQPVKLWISTYEHRLVPDKAAWSDVGPLLTRHGSESLVADDREEGS